MRKRNVVAVASTVVVLGFAGPAAAQQPNQHGNPLGGGQPGAAGEVGGGGTLPFTGFHAALMLLGGAGVAATGLALRLSGRSRKS